MFLFVVADSELFRLRAEECGMEVTLCPAQGQLHARDFSVWSCQECVRVSNILKMEKAALGVTVLAQHWKEVRRLRFVMPEMTIA